MKSILFVGLGGFAGSILRYLISKAVSNATITAFPIGTFIVNIIGCFLIGLLYAISDKYGILNQEWKLLLTVGLCGGFTTFSTFANESLLLLKSGNLLYFLLYTSLSVLIGIFATFLAVIIVKTA